MYGYYICDMCISADILSNLLKKRKIENKRKEVVEGESPGGVDGVETSFGI